MNELLPCPFCGGEAYTLNQAPRGTGYSVGCPDDECRGFIALSWIYKTEAEAIAAWNARHHSEFEKTVIKAWEEIKGYQERTCKADYRSGGYGIGGWYCSECGGYMHDDMQQDMAYCPNCGARVIGADE